MAPRSGSDHPHIWAREDPFPRLRPDTGCRGFASPCSGRSRPRDLLTAVPRSRPLAAGRPRSPPRPAPRPPPGGCAPQPPARERWQRLRPERLGNGAALAPPRRTALTRADQGHGGCWSRARLALAPVSASGSRGSASGACVPGPRGGRGDRGTVPLALVLPPSPAAGPRRPLPSANVFGGPAPRRSGELPLAASDLWDQCTSSACQAANPTEHSLPSRHAPGGGALPWQPSARGA